MIKRMNFPNWAFYNFSKLVNTKISNDEKGELSEQNILQISSLKNLPIDECYVFQKRGSTGVEVSKLYMFGQVISFKFLLTKHVRPHDKSFARTFAWSVRTSFWLQPPG